MAVQKFEFSVHPSCKNEIIPNFCSCGATMLAAEIGTAVPGKALRSIGCSWSGMLAIIFEEELTAGEITALNNCYTAWVGA